MQSGWLDQFYKRRTAEPKTEPDTAPAVEGAGEVSRRDFLHSGLVTGVTAGMAAGGMLAQTQVAQAQATGDTPIGPKWWPSRWGPQDESGGSNWITPAKVLEAAKLIKTGKIYEIGRVYESKMPLYGERVFALRIPGTPTGGPFGKNKLIYHDEFVCTEIGQVGTQFDGLGHIGCVVGKEGDMTEMRFYNGFTEAEIGNPYGLQKLGVEKIKPLFTRGVLVDVAGLKGRMMNMGEEITVADVQAALQRQGIAESSIQPGDGVFFNTGWGTLWMKDNSKFNEGAPGIGVAVARWCVGKQLALVGSDHWATDVVPNPDPDLAFIAHQELITKNGILNHENLDFDELIKDKVSEFVYVFAPVRLKGATGSAGRPIAIV
ncbi:MAG TPA: cyclase family protein [Methylomirabilota bacterium]|jgi:kynurenine formamidase